MKRAFLSTLVFAGVLFAQVGPPPGGFGPFGPRDGRHRPRLEALKTALNLSDDQMQQLIEHVRTERQAMGESLRADGVPDKLRDNHQKLQDMLQSGAADPAAVGAIVIENQALKAKVKEARDRVKQSIVDFVSVTLARADALAALQTAAAAQAAVAQARAIGLIEGGGRGRGLGGPGAFGRRRGGGNGFGFRSPRQ